VTRDLPWEGCANVRDLGGLRVARGTQTAFHVVVRADNARQLTDSGWQAAADYGITTVLDLRSDPECAADPPAHPGFVHRRLSLFEDYDGDPAYRADLHRRVAALDIDEKNRVLYSEALDRNAPRFADALKAIAAAVPGGTLVHCSGGKDRTGVLAGLLLRLVGVPFDGVEADYVRSETRLGIPNSAPAGVIVPVIERIETLHGSTRRFFLDAGASTEDVDRLAQALLGGHPPRTASLG
jgi:protein-tyrosine phosphatase